MCKVMHLVATFFGAVSGMQPAKMYLLMLTAVLETPELAEGDLDNQTLKNTVSAQVHVNCRG